MINLVCFLGGLFLVLFIAKIWNHEDRINQLENNKD